jgi:serine phosphatase RsbU (regulator of sigma subunit)
MKQLYLLLFLISALCKLSSAQQINQLPKHAYLDIDMKVYLSDSEKSKKPISIIVLKNDSLYIKKDTLSQTKVRLTLPFGSNYSLTVYSKGYMSKGILISLKDSLDYSAIEKRTVNYYYPIVIMLVPQSYMTNKTKEEFKSIGFIGQLVWNNKEKDISDNKEYSKKIQSKLKSISDQIELIVANPEIGKQLVQLGDSIEKVNDNLIVKSQELEAEKFTRLELEKKSLEERLIFEKQAQQKQLELLQKEAVLQKTSLQNLLNQKNIVSLSQANEIQKLDAAQKQTAITQLQQQEQYNQTRINLLNVEKREKQKETELKDAEIKSQRTTRLFLLAGLLAALVLLFFIFRSYRIKQKANHIITLQKEEVEKQRNIVVHQNREILDSIEYAKRIQATILPPPKVVKKYLEDSFILYIPKDIVAGDFYWMDSVELENKDSEYILFAACDCTGHGVPGALVSVVCSNALNRAVREYNIIQPSLILDKVSELVVQDFSKDENEEVQDGMDASLCSLNVKTGKLEWAGANNALWIVASPQPSPKGREQGIPNSNDSISNLESAEKYPLRGDLEGLIEVKPDKQPIGKSDNKKPFTNHSIQLQKGDTIYMFTDGYADQFGGEKGKKYSKKAFRELVLSIAHLPLQQQREALYKAHLQWRGNKEQVDDICIIGVRVQNKLVY